MSAPIDDNQVPKIPDLALAVNISRLYLAYLRKTNQLTFTHIL